MTITPEDIAAFADGELSGEREAQVAAAIEADPELAQQVERHKSLKSMLAGHYSPVLDQAVPDRLAAMLAQPQPAQVVDFAAAREQRESRRRQPHWGWIAGSALAASLALAVILPGSGGEVPAYADTQLAGVLDDRLVADQSPGDETRVLLSFRSEEGRYCRAFSGSAGGGLACRDEAGWKLEALGEGSEGASSDYRMAGVGEAEILALAQEMAAGPALDAQEEQAAREQGWR
ncbi:anti-sigma factor [Altererythrobacter sp. H2]|uniref:anti-sigma factor family protein n=1 Tax=Altererythrobacter sp. H2 TaxID=3108391 RepID=UPI002B4C1296|nr:anti-sigma factor [Altererythrobacter sp. H2]WRK95447.1 anti-sigma factor [Altererythrobacter sp. H2]